MKRKKKRKLDLKLHTGLPDTLYELGKVAIEDARYALKYMPGISFNYRYPLMMNKARCTAGFMGLVMLRRVDGILEGRLPRISWEWDQIALRRDGIVTGGFRHRHPRSTSLTSCDVTDRGDSEKLHAINCLSKGEISDASECMHNIGLHTRQLSKECGHVATGPHSIFEGAEELTGFLADFEKVLPVIKKLELPVLPVLEKEA